ncbi:MAG TPA: hypothetical protein VFX49_05745 [Chloroflexota bacterium]|nr:hypothetical protein [Chloroflexota bacterium]
MPRSAAAAPPRSRSPRPSTRRGRAARNALAHGLRSLIPVVPGVESEEEWLAHLHAVIQELAPVGHIETLHANHIALDFWRLKRLARFEILLVTHSDPNARPDDASPAAPAALAAGAAPADDQDEDDEDDDGDEERPAADDEDDDYADWEQIEASMGPHARRLLRCFDLVMFADESQPLDPSDALAVVDAIRGRICAFPLSSFAVPGTSDTPLTEHTAWTGGLVRRTIRAICERFHKDPATEVSTTVDVYRDIAERYSAPPGARSTAPNPLATHPLPPAHLLDRLIRYEAHLRRDLRLWLADLRDLQALRLERTLLSPDSTDSTDSAAPAAPESDETTVSAKRNGSTR